LQDAGLRLAITLAQKAVKTALSTVKHEQPLLNPLLVGGVADSVADSVALGRSLGRSLGGSLGRFLGRLRSLRSLRSSQILGRSWDSPQILWADLWAD